VREISASVLVFAASRGRERAMAAVFLAGVAAVWIAALALLAASGHGGGAHPHLHAGHGAGAGGPGFPALAAMWTGMMVAMMVPPELPALARLAPPRPGWPSLARPAAFFAGLVGAWTAFSAFAALLHWALERRGLVEANGVLASPVAAALLLGSIGAFQLTPFKRTCLEHCRAGVGPLAPDLPPGGAFLSGLRKGTASMGSCALLMLLPFAYGGMGLAPMAAVTALLVAEKLGRRGLLAGRVAGAALVALGAAVLVQGG
jgi:predicted metal-binding membrane protein